MDNKKIDAGLDITVSNNTIDIKYAFDDCEATIKLFMAFWTMLKKDEHAKRHFFQAISMAEDIKDQILTVDKNKQIN